MTIFLKHPKMPHVLLATKTDLGPSPGIYGPVTEPKPGNPRFVIGGQLSLGSYKRYEIPNIKVRDFASIHRDPTMVESYPNPVTEIGFGTSIFLDGGLESHLLKRLDAE